MKIRTLLPLLLVLLLATVNHSEVIEVNSSTPYSSGIVKFTNEDIHFSTGLTLTRKENFHYYSGAIYFCNADTLLYTSYVVDSTKGTGSHQSMLISTWDSVKVVDTSMNVLDTSYDEHTPIFNFTGHYSYSILDNPPYYIIYEPDTAGGILISQDSSGNYIKWQVVDFQSVTDTTSDKAFDEMIITETITGIYLKWEIDSLGNGQFPCSPVSNKKIISSNTSSNHIKHIQVNNRLAFPAYETLHIAIYKSNGQLVKVSDGITNFIDLSGISKGFYIAQIKSKGMKKFVSFRIE